MANEISISRDIPFSQLGTCLFRCWTDPELLKQWFCPRPWKVTHAEIDPRPGGRFNTTMAGPDGEEVVSEGSFLEVVEDQKLVFTSALREGWQPIDGLFADANSLPFVATIRFDDLGDGRLRYTACATHWSEDHRARHEAMGFVPGWNAALDQLIELSAANQSLDDTD